MCSFLSISLLYFEGSRNESYMLSNVMNEKGHLVIFKSKTYFLKLKM